MGQKTGEAWKETKTATQKTVNVVTDAFKHTGPKVEEEAREFISAFKENQKGE